MCVCNNSGIENDVHHHDRNELIEIISVGVVAVSRNHDNAHRNCCNYFGENYSHQQSLRKSRQVKKMIFTSPFFLVLYVTFHHIYDLFEGTVVK